MFQTVTQIFHNLTKRESFYHGLFLSIITIAVVWLIYRLATKGLRRHFLRRAQIASDISRAIIKEFNQQDNVVFAYPHMQVLR